MGVLFRLSGKTAKTTKAGDYCDGAGLWLCVESASSRKWVYRFTLNGKPNEMGLGSANAVSLGLARDRAQSAREQVAIGVDPIAARRGAKAREACPSFGEVSSELIESKRPEWRSPIHARQWAALRGQCARIWDVPVNSLGVIDILDVLKPLWTATPETASRVRGRIESVLDAAKARGLRNGENPATWRGHLEHLLAKRQKIERPHHSAMAYRDIPEFVSRLREHPDVPCLAVEFLILTACRSTEVRDATWREVDLERATWTLPPPRTKTGTAHVVPLAPRAVEILRSAAGQQRGGLVFPGRNNGRPISSSAVTAILPEGVTLRGFRSAFRDWSAERTNFPREACEQALGHTVGNAVERAYRRTDLLEQRRELMNLWSQFSEPAAPTNVVSIAKVRA